MEHAYFRPLTECSGELRWQRAIDLDGRAVDVDMTSDPDVTHAQLDAAAAFVRELPRFDAAARAALLRDEGEDTAFRLYIDHHLSELRSEELQSLFGTTQASAITPALFLSRMTLRVHLHPCDAAHTAWFDYTLEGEVTQYLMSVRFSTPAARPCPSTWRAERDGVRSPPWTSACATSSSSTRAPCPCRTARRWSRAWTASSASDASRKGPSAGSRRRTAMRWT